MKGLAITYAPDLAEVTPQSIAGELEDMAAMLHQRATVLHHEWPIDRTWMERAEKVHAELLALAEGLRGGQR